MSTDYLKDHDSPFKSEPPAADKAVPQPAADSLTYELYFGLNEKPFSLESDPRFLYASAAREVARKGLIASLRRREGLLVLTGEIGTGKTTLCRTVIRDLGANTYSSLVLDPFAAREDLLKMLLIDFGVMSIHDLTASRFQRISRTELGYLLSEFLATLHRDAFAVVVIDEAQHLALPLIEEARILFDTFGANGRLQIVFVGQPELHGKLKLPEMRQVDQRICAYHRLAPMNRESVAGYVQHRLHVAGAAKDRTLFPAGLFDVLHQRTGGVPRLINRVCDRALVLAFERKAHHVTQEILDAALIEVGSITLLPTWDSIVFGEDQRPPAAPAKPAAVSKPRQAAQSRDADEFKAQMDEWLDRELAALPLASTSAATVDVAPPRAVPVTAPNRQVIPDKGTVSVSADHDFEMPPPPPTWRRWAARTAIAAVAFAVVITAALALPLIVGAQSAPALPDRPDAPTKVLPVLTLPTGTEFVGADTSAEFLIVAGAFTPIPAQELIDTLRDVGLAAYGRRTSSLLRQVVLGPFASRGQALVALRRLQSLGGYQDAAVIDSTDESFSQ